MICSLCSRSTQEESLELETPYPPGPLIPPCPINLDDDVDIVEDIVIFTAHSEIRRGTLRSSNRAIAVKTCRDTDPTTIEVKAFRNTRITLLTSPQHAYREVRIWSQLRHESIMPLLGITTKFNHTESMVTEWMERGNAHKYVQDVAVDPRPLVRRLAQLLDIARGLNYLHVSGIVHGDLKGINVLISGEGRGLITDFGFSYQSNPPSGSGVNPPRGGTLRWMAPENLNTYDISQQADVWAFGMTALELFSRRDPFHKAHTPEGIAACILRGPPTRPDNESTSSRLCDEWWSLCLECWNSESSARPAMNDIVTKIERLNEGAV
ncbi:kinase-like domain-containing protein [Pisolithus marmoratus]|nr:kinase-like domain-containing protein [Pisolithus marmoratus]